jgi:hypothetical protein
MNCSILNGVPVGKEGKYQSPLGWLLLWPRQDLNPGREAKERREEGQTSTEICSNQGPAHRRQEG